MYMGFWREHSKLKFESVFSFLYLAPYSDLWGITFNRLWFGTEKPLQFLLMFNQKSSECSKQLKSLDVLIKPVYLEVRR